LGCGDPVGESSDDIGGFDATADVDARGEGEFREPLDPTCCAVGCRNGSAELATDSAETVKP
jgi:hypothetical protein